RSMKISLSWLKDYVDFDWSVPELCDKLTMAGIEFEGLEVRGANIPHVVTAEILSSVQHPNADRLSVCQVVTGGPETKRQIVCGAKNYRVGDRVPLALPGAVMPGGFAIKESKLRGELSQGMMCSTKELGLAEDAEGLLILPKDTPLGVPISDLFPPETIIEVEVTPNRPDLLSHIGIARELLALGARNLRYPDAGIPGNLGTPATARFSVTNETGEDCPAYAGAYAEGVTVAPSPDWLRKRIESIGLRPVNNVVDITNFVLHECGHPLHAFDFARLSGGKIVIRHAREGETIRALDGRDYTLSPGMPVIADAQNAVAIAGIMGGELSGVTAQTHAILLESAVFRPTLIRKTSRALSLSSDSSYRFERGVDPVNAAWAIRRAAHLLAQVTGARFASGTVETGSTASCSRPVTLRIPRLNRVLGTNLTADEVSTILQNLAIAVTPSGDTLETTPPSYRNDLRQEIDLVEEIARIHGLDRIPARYGLSLSPASRADAHQVRLTQLRHILNGLGATEISTHKIVPEPVEQVNRTLQSAETVRLLNPLASDHTVMRSGLAGNMLAALRLNVTRKNPDLCLFETGKVFALQAGCPSERLHLCVAITGNQLSQEWNQTARACDFSDLKGLLSALLEHMGAGELILEKPAHNAAEPVLELAAEIRLHGRVIGQCGVVSYEALRQFDLPAATFLAEFDLAGILEMSPHTQATTELPRFPAVERDMALIVGKSITHADILNAAHKEKNILLENIHLFDIFEDAKGERVPTGSKSMAYRFTYRSLEKTLTDQEVNSAHDRLKTQIAQAVGGSLRE
ncbi:MAG: phenylalanine--tRNA ligase subunit beta, partial [Verrucomicrobiae bacterium]|nr:phenylalanine--tRNA ligase subunit beta [Verrucomicrobiae bacterium]